MSNGFYYNSTIYYFVLFIIYFCKYVFVLYNYSNNSYYTLFA